MPKQRDSNTAPANPAPRKPAPAPKSASFDDDDISVLIATMLRVFVLRTDHNARSLWLFLRNNWRALAGDGKPLSVTVQNTKRSGQRPEPALLGDPEQITAGAWIGGRRYGADAWHEFSKRA